MKKYFLLSTYFLLSINSNLQCNEVVFSCPEEIICNHNLKDIKVIYRDNNFYVISEEKEFLVKKYSIDSFLKSLTSDQLEKFKKKCYLKVKRHEDGEYSIKSVVPLPHENKSDIDIPTEVPLTIVAGTGLLYFLLKTNLKKTFIGTEKEINSPHYKHKMAARVASFLGCGVIGAACPPLGIAAVTAAWIAADAVHAGVDGADIFKDDAN